MLVYGDRVRAAAPAALLAQLGARGGRAPGKEASDLDRATEALILAGMLAQGLADAEMAASGVDDATLLQAAAMALVTAEAGALLAADGQQPASASGPCPAAARARLAALPMPPSIRCRIPEGFAFYALAPQACAAAAASIRWERPPLVIGIRSIGTSLAAVIAARLGAEALTVRPCGHPLQRRLRLSARLAARLRTHRGRFLVVDEGPGFSGSSFGSVAEALAALGVAPGRIVFLPSHGGDPGRCATPALQALWKQATRLVPEPVRSEAIARRFADLTGPAAIEDLSAGAWRRELSATLPATPAVERMKVGLAGPAGRFVVRFAGLGATGTAKLALARRLHTAGFCPEPLALRGGFLLERWIEGQPLGAGERPPFDHLARYLGFRARAFPAGEDDGAPPATLAEMAAFNAGELGGEEVRHRVTKALAGGAWATGLVPVRIDGQLHRWEWRRAADGRLVKTDALDHATGHDLVGCQDIAWDVAGAAVEFDLSHAEALRLGQAVADTAGRPVSAAAVAAFRLCYAAFQGGLWRMLGAPGPATEATVARYGAALRSAAGVAAGALACETVLP